MTNLSVPLYLKSMWLSCETWVMKGIHFKLNCTWGFNCITFGFDLAAHSHCIFCCCAFFKLQLLLFMLNKNSVSFTLSRKVLNPDISTGKLYHFTEVKYEIRRGFTLCRVCVCLIPFGVGVGVVFKQGCGWVWGCSYMHRCTYSRTCLCMCVCICVCVSNWNVGFVLKCDIIFS